MNKSNQDRFNRKIGTTRAFIDTNGEVLIVRHRRSAIFFERVADISQPNSFGVKHADYVTMPELRRVYVFSDEELYELYQYCEQIAHESWSGFTPLLADSYRADYDDYYDKEFDNNGRLGLQGNRLLVEGPYTQLKENGPIVRLIQFNKRTFASFLYDLAQLVL